MNKYYYKDGTTSAKRDYSRVLHEIEGPAVVFDDDKWWYVDGKLHRIDGPAMEYGSGTKAWYIDDKYYSEEDFNKFIAEVKQLPLALRLIDPREWVRNYGK